jgi:hypothetical protein
MWRSFFTFLLLLYIYIYIFAFDVYGNSIVKKCINIFLIYIYIYLHSMYMVIPLLRSALISFLHFGHRKDALCLNLSVTGKCFWTNL